MHVYYIVVLADIVGIVGIFFKGIVTLHGNFNARKQSVLKQNVTSKCSWDKRSKGGTNMYVSEITLKWDRVRH